MFVNVSRNHTIKVTEISLLKSNIKEHHPKPQTYKASKTTLQNLTRFSIKWRFLQLFFWSQWLQLPWKNALAHIFLSRSRMVIISYFYRYNEMLDLYQVTHSNFFLQYLSLKIDYNVMRMFKGSMRGSEDLTLAL